MATEKSAPPGTHFGHQSHQSQLQRILTEAIHRRKGLPGVFRTNGNERASTILTSNNSFLDRERDLWRHGAGDGHPGPPAASLHHDQHQGGKLPHQGEEEGGPSRKILATQNYRGGCRRITRVRHPTDIPLFRDKFILSKPRCNSFLCPYSILHRLNTPDHEARPWRVQPQR